MDLPVAFYSSLLTVKSVNSVVAHNGFLSITENFSNFHNDYTVAFYDSYYTAEQ